MVCGRQANQRRTPDLKEGADQLKSRLRRFGLSEFAIDAAWPTWWSDAADASSSAQAELRFSLARKLGLDPHSLLEDAAEPRFVWRKEARFKHATAEGEQERAGITSFGVALGNLLISATEIPAAAIELNPHQLRAAI